jgi:DNA processing protein
MPSEWVIACSARVKQIRAIQKALVEREELAGWLRLTLSSGVGNESARKLLAAFGLPGAVFGQSASALGQVVSAAQCAALRTEPSELAPLLEHTWRWLQEAGAAGELRQIVVLGDANYPQSLLNISDPPLMLYLLGPSRLMDKWLPGTVHQADAAIDIVANIFTADSLGSIAIVGSRNPTAQGTANARQFSRVLSQAGMSVISGMALGVDGAAHEGALEGLAPDSRRLATIAVVGTGLDRVYPSKHLGLAHRIVQNGLIVSEYPLGTPPLPANFPKRNRLIAGLALGTLVVEAALKSGSLITARLSAEQGREVFAIPGSIHSTQARGCHALIKQGAKLVESAQDVLEELKIDPVPENASNFIAAQAGSTGDSGCFDAENRVLDALGFDPVGLDALQARCELDTANLQAQLMTLELDGQIARLPGGLFQRLGAG